MKINRPFLFLLWSLIGFVPVFSLSFPIIIWLAHFARLASGLSVASISVNQCIINKDFS